MAYGNSNNGSASNGKSYGNKPYAKPAAGASKSTTGANPEDKALFRKFLRASKSGKSLVAAVGDTDIVIPSGTRMVVTELTEKRKTALEASSKAKGFKGTVPTHELVILPIDDEKKQ